MRNETTDYIRTDIGWERERQRYKEIDRKKKQSKCVEWANDEIDVSSH